MSFKKPNILMIICHDLGQMLHCYGNRYIKSPNIDSIAEKGVVFLNHFCASTPCSPSRGCIITGRYAHSNGLMGLVNRGWDLPKDQRTIPQYLNEAGYETYLFGFQHERKDAATLGYKHINLESWWCEKVAANVVKFLTSKKAKEKPFFVNAGFFEVHLPFNRKEYKPASINEVEVPAYLPDNKDVREELARFYGTIEFMDKAVGKILRALKKSNLEDNTIVIFTTDHGMAFPRAKSTMYDSGIKTSFIIKWPGVIPKGKFYNELISNIDLLPTLVEIVGGNKSSKIQGRSFLGLLIGSKYNERTEIFSEKNFHDVYDPIRAIRTDRYKYIRSFEKRTYGAMSLDIKASQASRTLPEKFYKQRPFEELYDIKKDPNELKNLARDVKYFKIKKELAKKLENWMRETSDPILKGKVIPPKEANWLCSPECFKEMSKK